MTGIDLCLLLASDTALTFLSSPRAIYLVIHLPA